MSSRCALICCLVFVFASHSGSGCGGAGANRLSSQRVEGWSQASLPGVGQDAAFDAAVQAMRQWFTRLEEVQPSRGVVQSEPSEYVQRGGTGRLRDGAIKYPNRMRRTATLLVQSTETGCVARCEVRVQRLDTADLRAFRDNNRFDDYPNETPIDREAGVDSEQAQQWTDLPRDRGLERDILEDLRRRVSDAGS
jgi:hypothetical protein